MNNILEFVMSTSGFQFSVFEPKLYGSDHPVANPRFLLEVGTLRGNHYVYVLRYHTILESMNYGNKLVLYKVYRTYII